MTGNESQLRFDIAETVSLYKDEPGIDTLLSLDLSPNVTIDDLGDTLKIVGALRLSGTYLSEAEADGSDSLAHLGDTGEALQGEELSYVIPVEITIPSNRAGRLSDITSEIQSFDYEVHSAHELAIEAELVIDGLRLDESEQPTRASFGEEEQAQASVLNNSFEESANTGGENNETGTEDIWATEELKTEPLHADDANQESANPIQEHDEVEAKPTEEEATDESDPSESDNVTDIEAIEPNLEEEQAEQSDTSAQAETQRDTQQETKINFQPKQEKTASNVIELDERLKTGAEGQETSFAQEQRAFDVQQDTDYEESASTDSGDAEHDISSDSDDQETSDSPMSDPGGGVGIAWMKEKLGGDTDRFHRLKMVIVQKEDTLEEIADRYDLSTVELLQVNQLDSGTLEAGQIVYIPDKD